MKDHEKTRQQLIEELADVRRQAEEALRDSEGRLNLALEISKIGAWDLNLVDHTAQRSLQHDRIFGYESLLPAWTYEMFLEHVLPEDRHAVDRQFRQAVECQGDWSFDCRIRRADGQIRWILGRRPPPPRHPWQSTTDGGSCPGHHRAEGGRGGRAGQRSGATTPCSTR